MSLLHILLWATALFYAMLICPIIAYAVWCRWHNAWRRSGGGGGGATIAQHSKQNETAAVSSHVTSPKRIQVKQTFAAEAAEAANRGDSGSSAASSATGTPDASTPDRYSIRMTQTTIGGGTDAVNAGLSGSSPHSHSSSGGKRPVITRLPTGESVTTTDDDEAAAEADHAPQPHPLSSLSLSTSRSPLSALHASHASPHSLSDDDSDDSDDQEILALERYFASDAPAAPSISALLRGPGSQLQINVGPPALSRPNSVPEHQVRIMPAAADSAPPTPDSILAAQSPYAAAFGPVGAADFSPLQTAPRSTIAQRILSSSMDHDGQSPPQQSPQRPPLRSSPSVATAAAASFRPSLSASIVPHSSPQLSSSSLFQQKLHAAMAASPLSAQLHQPRLLFQ